MGETAPETVVPYEQFVAHRDRRLRTLEVLRSQTREQKPEGGVILSSPASIPSAPDPAPSDACTLAPANGCGTPNE